MKCWVKDCVRKTTAKGLCHAHYGWLVRRAKIGHLMGLCVEPRKCRICGEKSRTHHLCKAHYMRISRAFRCVVERERQKYQKGLSPEELIRIIEGEKK